MILLGFLFTINNLNFHKSKLISSTNFISGGIINERKKITDYFNLKQENETLIKENTILRNKLALLKSKDSISQTFIKDTIYRQKYSYINGEIIKNEYHKPANFLTINLGIKNGITKEMAVINDKGIIGIIDDVSNHYARVQSILNRNSKINARFKNSFYFGSLSWNGKNPNTVQLTDIPRQATFKKGDTIITGGKSTIFPEGIPIGTVINFPKKLSASNTLDIKLFNDMSNIGYIYVINSYDKDEVKSLNSDKNASK